MTKEEFQLEKAKEISERIIRAAEKIAKITPVAYPPKRAFRKKDKKKVRLNRNRKKDARLNLVLVPAIAASDLAMIIAQPFPKYPKGSTEHPGGAAILNAGPEITMYSLPENLNGLKA